MAVLFVGGGWALWRCRARLFVAICTSPSSKGNSEERFTERSSLHRQARGPSWEGQERGGNGALQAIFTQQCSERQSSF